MYRVLNKPLWPFLIAIWLILLGLWTVFILFFNWIFPQVSTISKIIQIIAFFGGYIVLCSLITTWLWRQFVVVRPSGLWMFRWDSGPWLSWVDEPSSSMVINWITKEESSTELEWGQEPNSLIKISGQRAKVHRIFLTELHSATCYHYRILNFPSDSNLHHFYTAPDPQDMTKPVSIIVVGDTQNGGGAGDSTWAYPKLIDHIEKTPFDLVMHTGDATDQGNDIKSWREFFDQSHRICADHPLHIAVGNHDTGSNYLQDKSIKKYRDDGANFDYFLGYNYGRPSSERFLTSLQSRYYALDYGCCLFLFVDTQNQQLAAPWSFQWEYLERIFSQSKKLW
jgi:hypothetical protein